MLYLVSLRCLAVGGVMDDGRMGGADDADRSIINREIFLPPWSGLFFLKNLTNDDTIVCPQIFFSINMCAYFTC